MQSGNKNFMQTIFKVCIQAAVNLVPRAMPVRGLGWHWLWGN